MSESKKEKQNELPELIGNAFGERLNRLPDFAGEYGLQYSVSVEDAYSVLELLKSDERFAFNMLIDVTAIDWLDARETRFDVVYHLLSIPHSTRLCIRIAVAESRAKVSSVRSLWHAANFLEREVWDMFGIEFEDHGDLRRIMMYEEFVGHPLRKDYPVQGKQPRVKLRIPELHNTAKDMTRERLVALPVRQRMPAVPTDVESSDS